jgi:hypothetical protein
MVSIRSAQMPFAGELLQTLAGEYVYEYYESGPQRRPAVAMAVVGTDGSPYSRFMRHQVAFALQDVGFDGVYLDQFSQTFFTDPLLRYSAAHSDGRTAELDEATNGIVSQLADTAISGAGDRIALAESVVAAGKVFIANTAACSRAAAGLAAMRFVEGWPVVNSTPSTLGQMPTLDRWLCKAQLGTPLALGYHGPPRWGPPTGEHTTDAMACVFSFLRHGLLYCHTDVVSAGPAMDVVRQMFPITPTAIHPGWIEGPERIVTAVSGDFRRTHPVAPIVVSFGADGRPVSVDVSMRREDQSWSVRLRQADWSTVSIIA